MKGYWEWKLSHSKCYSSGFQWKSFEKFMKICRRRILWNSADTHFSVCMDIVFCIWILFQKNCDIREKFWNIYIEVFNSETLYSENGRELRYHCVIKMTIPYAHYTVPWFIFTIFTNLRASLWKSYFVRISSLPIHEKYPGAYFEEKIRRVS